MLHLPAQSRSFLPAILDEAGRWSVVPAVHNMPIKQGHIYVAPTDQHLIVEPGRVVLSSGPKENWFRPAINTLFRSAAEAYGPRVTGVILTGLLEDGVAGLWAIKRCGGVTIVQSDAQFNQMPQSALEYVSIDHNVPLAELPSLLERLVSESAPVTGGGIVPETVRLRNDTMKMEKVEIELDRFGERTLFTCPECNGKLWEVKEGKQVQYSCHVGHAYTSRALTDGQEISLEASLWSAVRALKENGALHERLAQRSSEDGMEVAAAVHRGNAARKMKEAAHVQSILNAAPGSAANGDKQSAPS